MAGDQEGIKAPTKVNCDRFGHSRPATVLYRTRHEKEMGALIDEARGPIVYGQPLAAWRISTDPGHYFALAFVATVRHDVMWGA